jgi:hypothetical protein
MDSIGYLSVKMGVIPLHYYTAWIGFSFLPTFITIIYGIVIVMINTVVVVIIIIIIIIIDSVIGIVAVLWDGRRRNFGLISRSVEGFSCASKRPSGSQVHPASYSTGGAVNLVPYTSSSADRDSITFFSDRNITSSWQVPKLKVSPVIFFQISERWNLCICISTMTTGQKMKMELISKTFCVETLPQAKRVSNLALW